MTGSGLVAVVDTRFSRDRLVHQVVIRERRHSRCICAKVYRPLARSAEPDNQVHTTAELYSCRRGSIRAQRLQLLSVPRKLVRARCDARVQTSLGIQSSAMYVRMQCVQGSSCLYRKSIGGRQAEQRWPPTALVYTFAEVEAHSYPYFQENQEL
jgi:hypothetical protein